MILMLAVISLIASPIDPVFASSQEMERVQEQPPSEKAGELYFFNFDLLVWDVKEDGLEYAYKNSQTQTNQSLTSFEPKAKFTPAFRVGMGTFLPYDEWTLGALYTYYYASKERTTSASFDPAAAPGPGIIAVWTYPAAFLNNNTAARFASAKNHWKIHSSFLDLSLQRCCRISPVFSLTPLFGVRSAWLHQHYNVDYSLGNEISAESGELSVLSSSINMSCFSNNVGPLFGLNSSWMIAKGFSLFANLSTSLLASYFHLGRGEEDLFIEDEINYSESIDLNDKYWTFRPQASLALGFSYEFHANPMRYYISGAYETQNWWKQNGLLRYIDELNSSSAGAYVSQTQGDLMFHGLTFEVGVSY